MTMTMLMTMINKMMQMVKTKMKEEDGDADNHVAVGWPACIGRYECRYGYESSSLYLAVVTLF